MLQLGCCEDRGHDGRLDPKDLDMFLSEVRSVQSAAKENPSEEFEDVFLYREHYHKDSTIGNALLNGFGRFMKPLETTRYERHASFRVMDETCEKYHTVALNEVLEKADLAFAPDLNHWLVHKRRSDGTASNYLLIYHHLFFLSPVADEMDQKRLTDATDWVVQRHNNVGYWIYRFFMDEASAT